MTPDVKVRGAESKHVWNLETWRVERSGFAVVSHGGEAPFFVEMALLLSPDVIRMRWVDVRAVWGIFGPPRSSVC